MPRIRGFEVVLQSHRKYPDEIIRLPVRATAFSAGYDFFVPEDVCIPAGGIGSFFTDVKAYMPGDEVLLLFVRSSAGIKKGLALANGTGIIDRDYFENPDNDGNIGLFLTNRTDRDVWILKGEKIAQGIFMKYYLTDDDSAGGDRTGGFGSTNA